LPDENAAVLSGKRRQGAVPERLPRYQAHADREEGHGLAAEEVLGGVVLLGAEEAEIDTDENADDQQASEQGVVGPSESEFLQLVAREE